MDFDCQVLDPPCASEDDIDCRGFWLRPMARQSAQQVKLLRKQSFASLIVVLEGVARWQPDLLLGYGQGGTIAALASMPMVLEAACRSRVTPTDSMEDYRRSWSGVRAVVAVNPLLLPQRREMNMLLEALPELSRTQPAGVYRGLIASKSYVHMGFARELGAAIGTTVEKETMSFDCLAAALYS